MAYDLAGNDGPVMGGDEILGDEMLGDLMYGDEMGDDLAMADAAILGARRRMAARRGGGMQRQAQPALTRPPLLTARPGVNPTAVGRLPLGFGVLSLAAGGSAGVLTARPQVPWRGSKLVISIAGVNIGNYAVTVQPVIGNKPVLAGAAAIDARSFPATGIDNNLISDSAAPGIDVTLNFVVTPVLGAGDTAVITATWIGDALT
jgi:hypothetical protein